MAIFDNFPYTNIHELNLDWIIKSTKEIKDKTDVLDETLILAENRADKCEEILKQIQSLFITPQMFGAVGDGITDDTLALTKLYDYAVENVSDVYFPNGTYCISNPIYVTDNYIMGDNAVIKVTSPMDYAVKFSMTVLDSREKSKTCIINVDCNALANYGIGSGVSANRTFYLSILNPVYCGFNETLTSNSNNENLYNVRVVNSKTRYCQFGIIADMDNNYGEINTINCIYGLKNTASTVNINHIHSWLWDDVADDILNDSAVIYSDVGNVSVNWLYQDDMRYAVSGAARTTTVNITNLVINKSDWAAYSLYPQNIFSFGGSSGVATVRINNVYDITQNGIQYTAAAGVRFYVDHYRNNNNTQFNVTDANELPDSGTYLLNGTGSNLPASGVDYVITCLAGSYLGTQLAVGNGGDVYTRKYRMDNRQFFAWTNLKHPKYRELSPWTTVPANGSATITFTHNKGADLANAQISVFCEVEATAVISAMDSTTMTVKVFNHTASDISCRVYYQGY